MPHWYSNHHGHGLGSSFSSGHQSASSSAPPSRPSSPTNSTRSRVPSAISVPSRESTLDSSDPLSDYLGGPPSSVGSQPLYGPYSSTTDMLHGGSGTNTPGGSYFNLPPIEIALDSDHLVLRGQGGDMNPAYLSGQIVLNLHESTNIKEIVMNLTGKAKVHFSEASGTGSRSHNYTHPIITHDWSFLQGDKRHTHTLKAGRHTFPFSFTIDGNLPSSIRTYSGDAAITYKLRATAVRSGLAHNYMTTRNFSLMRSFTPEALEFNQTLEIENTWPGKVMYSLTLPHKAYAAGDDIPINVKFMPLAKGVRVLSINSVIKEYTLVHTRSSSHPDARVAASVKHEMRNGLAVDLPSEAFFPRAPSGFHPEPHQTPSFTPGLEGGSHTYSGPRSHTVASGFSSSSQSGFATPARAPIPSVSSQRQPAWGDRPPDSYFPAPAESPSNAVAGSSTVQAGESVSEEDIEIGDDEINTSLSVPIPSWTTPTHTIHPVFVTHKIKWSCSISNPDGHISELRCALPIHIIDNSLLDEAHTAGAQTRNLLFGNGESDEAQQVDLPSYSNHVYDRVAVADSSATSSGFMPRSVHATPMHSPTSATPPHSRPPSRPGSPNRGFRANDGVPAGDIPPRPELSSWADSELLLSLGALNVGSRPNSHENSPGETPPDSRGHSRPQSRSGFRSGRSSNHGSRSNSRASSPERPQAGSASSSYVANEDANRPATDRRGSGLHNLLHLPSSLKPMKPLSAIGGGKAPILRNGSAANLAQERNGSGSGITRNAFSFTNLGSSHSNGNGHGVSFAPQPERPADARRARFQVDGHETPPPEDVDPLSQVPSYAIASRGFLGGGVTPIALDLPTYDASERAIERTRSELDVGELGRARSDTALVALGADAAAQAEDRAADEGEADPRGG